MDLSGGLRAAASVGTWIARIGGGLMSLFFLAFAIGEGLPPITRLNLHEQLHFLGLTFMCAGLLLAWKWQALGALLTLAGFLLAAGGDSSAVREWPYLVPASMGALHLLCWLPLRGASPGRLPAPLWVAALVFITLCANEMFLNPPLMARGIGRAAGTWRSPDNRIELSVQTDGRVSGTFGDATVDARIAANRSWFGKVLHWRSDYLIRGAGFTAWLDSRGGALEGPAAAGRDRMEITLYKTSP